MELLFACLVLNLLALPFAIGQLRHELRRQRVCRAARALGVTVATGFLTEPCSRCRQREMGLVWVSPNARSIHYECRHCQAKLHADAKSPEAEEAAPQYQVFQALLGAFNERYRRGLAIDIVFQTTEEPLRAEV